MSVFTVVKENVTALQVAERYGLRVNPKGMACCPFHHDKTPSMKIDSRYYCFGCGVTGDAVDLAAKLLGVGTKDAALTVAEDFGLNYSEKAVRKRKRKVLAKPKVDPKKEASEWISKAVRFLLDYREQLIEWKKKYAPQTVDEEWHPLFCEALSKMEWVEYLLDELLFCNKADYEEVHKWARKEVEKLEHRLEQLRKRESGYDSSTQGHSGKDREGKSQTVKEQCPSGADVRSSSEGSISVESHDRKNRCGKGSWMESR